MTTDSISRSEYDRLRAENLKEQQLQDLILAAARRLGWLAYHTYDSRRSQPGFPDLVLARGRRLIFRELKAQKGRLRPDQHAWLHALEAAGADACVWRPLDWFNNTIITDLEEAHR